MSRSFVTDAVVATLERLGRGSCADIERWLRRVVRSEMTSGHRACRWSTR